MSDILNSFDSKLFDVLSQSSSRLFFYYADMSEGKMIWSKPAVEYFGLPGEVIKPYTIWYDKIHPDDYDTFISEFTEVINGTTPYHNSEYRIKNAAGEYVWVNCLGYMTYNDKGEADFFAGVITNMGTINKIDPVTTLHTEYVFRSEVTKMLDNGQCGAALQLDISHFKRINSNYGYSFGDSVLYSLGQKLMNLLDPNAAIYREDGAQFVIIIKNGTADDVNALMRRINSAVHTISVNNTSVNIEFSSAATFFPQDGKFIDEIQTNLFYSIEYAKHSNTKETVFFSPDILEDRNRILRMAEALKNSIDDNFSGFRVVLQPIIDRKTNTCFSAEALLRWSNEEFPDASPADFIPILEESKYIVPVGKWVINETLKKVSEWNSMSSANKLKHVNVNFSYIQFKDDSLLDFVVEKLDEYKLPHDTLIAELTESCRVEFTDKLAEILCSFHNQGIKIALDDFGTGYSSLMVLKDIPADIVKLDHTMTKTIVDRPKDRNLVEFIITYCNKMDIEVCTEGVETETTLGIVQSAGAEYIQGYLYDRPLEPDAFFEKYIK